MVRDHRLFPAQRKGRLNSCVVKETNSGFCDGYTSTPGNDNWGAQECNEKVSFASKNHV